MKKNTIFLVIDSLYYEKTTKQEYRNSPMPFLDKLRNEGYDFTNMYSEAPYTEAALVSLLCGLDTLKRGGYLKKFYNKETIMETFKKNNYDTFCNCSQPLVYPSYSYPGLTEEYYNVCYEFEAVWAYRFDFYSKLYKDDKLNDDTLNIVIQILEDNLNVWYSFFESLKNDKKITSFIRPYVNISGLDDNISLLKDELKRFDDNKKEYTKRLLELGKEHSLFNIHTYNLSKKMTKENREKLYYRYKKVIRKMLYKTIIYNLKNNKLILTPKEDRKNLIKNYINAVYNRFLYRKIDYNIESKKAAPSMHTTIKHFENWLLTKESDNPYFAYIHVDDCHSSEMFYTYDTDDFGLLDEEFNAINNYMNNLPKNYKGSISYDVSLQYADICIRRLYEILEKHNLLDDVNIVICADHGSSYSFAPYRANFVNNVHKENYNMPFVIWNNELRHKSFDGFYNSKDIPATILDLNNLEIPKWYDGISAIKEKPRDYVLLENVNGGCPDYNIRDILLGIRNNNYLVVMNLNLNKKFSDGEIYSVYDLNHDKEELFNLKDSIDRNIIKKELKIIEKEFNKLKEDVKTNNFLKDGE